MSKNNRQFFRSVSPLVALCCRQNLADAIRQDEKVDRKIARNQNNFEALDFNAAVGDSRMSPASAFVATIRGD